MGIFDPNGITNSSLDCELSVGETLVGSGVWRQQQMEIVAIESVNLCDLGGFLLGGYQVDSEIIIKVFSNVDQTGTMHSFLYNWREYMGTINICYK